MTSCNVTFFISELWRNYIAFVSEFSTQIMDKGSANQDENRMNNIINNKEFYKRTRDIFYGENVSSASRGVYDEKYIQKRNRCFDCSKPLRSVMSRLCRNCSINQSGK